MSNRDRRAWPRFFVRGWDPGPTLSGATPFGNLVPALALALIHVGFALQSESELHLVNHALLFLAAATLLYCFADLLVTSAATSIVRSDLERVKDLAERLSHRDLEGDEVESLANKLRDLSAGLPYAVALSESANDGGRSSSERSFDFAASQLIGGPWRSFVIRSATLVGLLGTVLGLKGAFESNDLAQSGVMKLDLVLPHVGLALVSTLMGIVVSLFALLVTDLLLRLLLEELSRQTTDTVVALAPSIRAAQSAEVVLPMAVVPSREVAAFRFGALLVGFCFAVVMTILGFRYGEPLLTSRLDTLVGEVDSAEQQEESENSEYETESATGPTTVREVVEYLQAAENLTASRLGFVSHPRVARGFDEMGASTRVAAGTESEKLFFGVVDVIDPPDARSRFENAFPRVWALVEAWRSPNASNDVELRAAAVVPSGARFELLTGTLGEVESDLEALGGWARSALMLMPEQVSRLSPRRRDLVQTTAELTWGADLRAIGLEKTEVYWVYYESLDKLELVMKELGDWRLEEAAGNFLVVEWSAPDGSFPTPVAAALEVPPRATSLMGGLQ